MVAFGIAQEPRKLKCWAWPLLQSLPCSICLMLRPALSLFNRSRLSAATGCYFNCRGAKALDELTTGLLLRPEETAMMVKAAGIQTGQKGLAKKEPMLELLLCRLATVIEAVDTLSTKRWGSCAAHWAAAERAAAWEAAPAALLLARVGHCNLGCSHACMEAVEQQGIGS